VGHRRARLTPFGRLLLVTRIEEAGWSVTTAAESLGVSRATAQSGFDASEKKGSSACRIAPRHRSVGRGRCPGAGFDRSAAPDADSRSDRIG
jgi:hypothetical protein